jgi:hypothetical protein
VVVALVVILEMGVEEEETLDSLVSQELAGRVAAVGLQM